MAKRRIFQIAKELNISHTEILSFLKGKGIAVGSHMAPINEETYAIVMEEFHKDKESIDRYRKEQIRREIHDTRIFEEQKANKKLQLLSLEEQRKLESDEKIKAKAEEERKAIEAKTQATQHDEKVKKEAEQKVLEVKREKEELIQKKKEPQKSKKETSKN